MKYMELRSNGFVKTANYMEKLEAENNSLKEKLAVAVEALERYADCNEYDRKECEKTYIAIEALKKIRGEA